MCTNIIFNPYLTPSDPHHEPVLIIGQLRHLALLKFTDINCKLETRVTEQTFKNAVSCLHPSPTDTSALYLDLATLAALPIKSSRHNTNSRAHSITRLVRSKSLSINETIVIVCERKDVFASGCAVVRAFPIYSRKSVQNDAPPTVKIEFVVIDNGDTVSSTELTVEDISCLEEAARGIRLTAKIVDMPCNEMNVCSFLKEIEQIAEELSLKSVVVRGKELEEQGFGGIYGVGKAATSPPALAVLSYEPQGATETIAWVGKGIVFDTGGLSIKGKTAMPGMKRDCGGAAAILGGFYAAVKSGFTENLHAVFCLAENSVAANATRRVFKLLLINFI